MVLCKYFQQGNCRFGQYCKFEHNYGNRGKNFSDDKNVALLVAEEIVHAERGGQWLLSCYGPFKEKKCIPGMDDVSPEEVRWEMYQAQKTGTTDQVAAQFQQMCQQMKVKREALKNPTQQIVQLLEEIQNSGSENAASNNKGSFPFGQSQQQLGSTTSNQASNVFAQKTFGSSSTTGNPFGSSSTFSSTQPSSSIFGRPTTTSTTTNAATSVFGGKPTFGGPSLFGGSNSTAGSSIFGGGAKPTSGPFGAVQSTQTFGGLAAQGNSVFGGSTIGQSTFGQTAAFGATAAQPAASSLFKPQGSQVFGGASTSTNVFGGGSIAGTQTAGTSSVFGGAPAVSSASPATGGIFSQPATSATSAFGGAPVFGGTPAFGGVPGASGGSVFGGQATFGSQPAFGGGAASTSSVFGASATGTGGTANFGSLAATGTNVFGGSQTPALTGNTMFGEVAPNASPFGQQAQPAATTGPFGQQPASTAATPFGVSAATSVFATSAPTTANAFGAAPSFGFAAPASNAGNVFGATVSSVASAAPAATQSVFSSNNAFGAVQPSASVFGTSTAATATGGNVFMAKPQQQSNTGSPFGTAPSTQASPFGNFAGKSSLGFAASVTIDETAYSLEENLTDEEKAAFKLAQFVEGCIPLKPPSKALA